MLEGSSEVNIVAEDGEIRYLECSVWSNASLKPVLKSVGHVVKIMEPNNL